MKKLPVKSESLKYIFGFFVVLIIGILEIIALFRNIDGVALSAALASITAVAGFIIGRGTKKII